MAKIARVRVLAHTRASVTEAFAVTNLIFIADDERLTTHKSRTTIGRAALP